jgi:hypothetical protein
VIEPWHEPSKGYKPERIELVNLFPEKIQVSGN